VGNIAFSLFYVNCIYISAGKIFFCLGPVFSCYK